MDPYEVLQIPKNSSFDIVKKAYINAAKECHPDKGGDARLFILLDKAYRMILNGPLPNSNANPTNSSPNHPNLTPTTNLGPFTSNTDARRSNNIETQSKKRSENEDSRMTRSISDFERENNRINSELRRQNPLMGLGTGRSFDNDLFNRTFEQLNPESAMNNDDPMGGPSGLVEELKHSIAFSSVPSSGKKNQKSSNDNKMTSPRGKSGNDKTNKYLGRKKDNDKNELYQRMENYRNEGMKLMRPGLDLSSQPLVGRAAATSSNNYYDLDPSSAQEEQNGPMDNLGNQEDLESPDGNENNDYQIIPYQEYQEQQPLVAQQKEIPVRHKLAPSNRYKPINHRDNQDPQVANLQLYQQMQQQQQQQQQMQQLQQQLQQQLYIQQQMQQQIQQQLLQQLQQQQYQAQIPYQYQTQQYQPHQYQTQQYQPQQYQQQYQQQQYQQQQYQQQQPMYNPQSMYQNAQEFQQLQPMEYQIGHEDEHDDEQEFDDEREEGGIGVERQEKDPDGQEGLAGQQEYARNYDYPGQRMNRFDLRDTSEDEIENEDRFIEKVVNNAIQVRGKYDNKNNFDDDYLEKRALQNKVAKLEKTCEVQHKLINKMMQKMGV